MSRYGRIAESVMVAYGRQFTFTRDFYLPHGDEAVNLKKLNPEGTDLEIYTYEDSQGKMYGIAFAAKQNKPLWNYRFRNEADRQREIDETVRGRKSRMEYMEKRRQERLQYRHGLKVGDILYSSWGYDQTNIDFYQVTAVGEKSVKIREIGQKLVSQRGPGGDEVVANPNHFTGPEMTKMVGQGDSVKVRSFAWARPWSGKPVYQTDPMFGH